MRILKNTAGAAALASSILAAGFGVAEAQPTDLKTLAIARGIDVGLALSSSSGGAAVDTVVTRNFTGFVPENATKWGNISSAPGVYSWTGTDGMLDFAQKYGMKMRFHTFVWHQQSSYIANGHTNGVAQPPEANKYTRAEAFTHMRNHIGAVMGHIKGRNGGQMHLISEWDVVNEAAARDSGNDDSQNLYGGMRRSTGNSVNLDSGLSRWTGYTQGETNDFDYIDSAFAIAHRNDTTARLVYNDYDAESLGKKSNTVYNLMAKLKNRKIPVHVLGMQCHWYIGPSNTGSSGAWDPQQIVTNMNRIAALGLDISITELDIRFQNPSDSTKLYQQRQAYETIMSICLNQPRCKKFYVWGLRDGSSWINSRFPGYGNPLLFSGSGSTYTPKPAYYGLIASLQTTSVRAPGARGAVRFTPAGPAYDIRGRQMKSLPAGPSSLVRKTVPAKAAR
ncbi:MAG: beta,4-xylanase [Fibrobacteria bacterium]|jgi:endo-1,4-beta-xylanase|nr:beta,4-xylanase [Fibrobacteria bacterium]